MEKIGISITRNTLKFFYKYTETNPITLDETNVIHTNELVFSKKYIDENFKLITNFIIELCQEKKISQVIIETNELALFLIDLFKKNPYIIAISIQENATLTYALYEKIIENKNINYIEANNIQQFMIDLLDKKGIHSESRTEIFYLSHFMRSNNLTSYSKIFYKMNVQIDEIFTKEDYDDFSAFCSLNKYLKTIHIDIYNQKDLENILKILEENRLKNIRILLYENIKNYKTIEYLKKLNKKGKSRKIKIELVYSKEYLSTNLFKQVIINTLKICGLLLIIIVTSIISYIGISNYKALQDVTKIQNDLQQKIMESENNPPEDFPNKNEELIIKNNYLVSLLSVNPDVTGWLKINNTNIDYPVVQAEDNEYYLKKNLYKDNDINGWIYMDYRNSKTILDSNTIIYGHNMYYSGVMFGTLSNAYKKSWYTNKENLVISFDTIYESNKYQIFSIYKIPKTTDYLKTYFASDQEFNDFVHMIKDRSIENFDVNVEPGDKLLTLSTCSNYNDRLVIHAKLIKTEE